MLCESLMLKDWEKKNQLGEKAPISWSIKRLKEAYKVETNKNMQKRSKS